jgi:serine protease
MPEVSILRDLVRVTSKGMRLRLAQMILVALAGTALAAPLAHASDPPYVPGEVLTKLKGEPGERDVKLPAGVTVPQAVRYLRAKPNVAYANPNYLASASALWNPNDPGTPAKPHGWRLDQWNFLAPTVAAPGGAAVQGAWQNLRDAGLPGGRGITVAVLDTGVAYRNKGTKYARDPDLPPVTRFVSPKDFVDGDQLPLDENGHGTHVASTIAQATDNARGLTGVAYGANLMPIRVLNRQEQGTASRIANGIRYAVEHGANVINLSLEFKPVVKQCSQIPGVCNALQAAALHGVVVVASAGNHHQPGVAYPARAGGVIAVGATTYRGCLADYSDYGPGLDLVAPGGGADTSTDTLNPSCDPAAPKYAIRQYALNRQAAAQGNFHKFGIIPLTGTSMAAAEVSGTAALLLAENPAWPRSEVESTIERCARPAANAKYYGAGLLNAAAATSGAGC